MNKKHDLLLLEYKFTKLLLSSLCDNISDINSNAYQKKRVRKNTKDNYELKRQPRKG